MLIHGIHDLPILFVREFTHEQKTDSVNPCICSRISPPLFPKGKRGIRDMHR